jgi:hypothetical protein
VRSKRFLCKMSLLLEILVESRRSSTKRESCPT